MHDLKLDENGDLPKTPTLDKGVEIVAQRLRRRLLLHRGEWLLDRREGVPYARWRERKPPSIVNIQAFLRDVIQGTPGVLSLREFRVEFVPSSHTVAIAGRVIVAGGAELTFDGSAGLDEDNVSGAIVFYTNSGSIL